MNTADIFSSVDILIRRSLYPFQFIEKDGGGEGRGGGNGEGDGIGEAAYWVLHAICIENYISKILLSSNCYFNNIPISQEACLL